MAIEKWGPPRDRRDAFGQIERGLENLPGHSAVPGLWQRFPMADIGWAPPMEVFERGNSYVVQVELPGVKERDVSISVVGDTLTIKGQKRTESEVKQGDYYHSERFYGSFLRSITLPAVVDARRTEARYGDGVLEVTLPKARRIRSPKTPVKSKPTGKSD